jgi:hypothetical protein
VVDAREQNLHVALQPLLQLRAAEVSPPPHL